MAVEVDVLVGDIEWSFSRAVMKLSTCPQVMADPAAGMPLA